MPSFLRLKSASAAIAVAALFCLSACGGGSNSPKTEEKSAAPAASAPAAALPSAETAATITGKIAYTVAKPEPATISMDATPACARQHKGPIVSEALIVNANGTLKNAFVWVKAGLPNAEWPAAAGSVTIDQKGCVYSPHVAGVRAGQDVEFLNSDTTNHNIHPMPRLNKEWNESQPPQGEKKIKTFDQPEVMIPIKCNVHPWMKVYIGVVNHPFFAVTGDDGSFELKGLPPGEYTVEAWHEKLGTQEMKVKVGAKESKSADFAFKG
jgi:plastocyanin